MILLKDVNRDKLSPMMRAYYDTKQQYSDSLLFYQCGDFYEMFFDDAVTTSRVLDLALTSKDCGLEKKAPMCGLPIHAINNYLSKLVQAGYKVVLVSQVGDPKLVTGKDLVKREVSKIVTAGTLTENIDEKKNNYILSAVMNKGEIALAYADITTGKLNVLEVASPKAFNDAVNRVCPSEIICNEEGKSLEAFVPEVRLSVLPNFYVFQSPAYDYARAQKICLRHFGVNNLQVFDLTDNNKTAIMAVGGLLEYLTETQKRSLTNINKINLEKPVQFMYVDSNTRKNLELTENMTTKKRRGSLLGLLDNTKTSMGARLLRARIDQPLTGETVINERLDAIQEFITKKMLTDEVRVVLSDINDIERISGKIGYGNIMPSDCNNLKMSLIKVKQLYAILKNTLTAKENKNAVDALVGFDDIIDELQKAIIDEPPANLKDGGYIKTGYNAQLDEYLNASTIGRKKLVAIEQQIREETGIRNIKVSYNRIFGYYIEVTKAQTSLVPQTWIRRQTTVNGERYINEEIKMIEDAILSSGENALKLEAELYAKLKEFLQSKIEILQTLSWAISTLDVNIALAVVSAENCWVRPVINNTIEEINIVDGKHPVVESLLKDSSFVPNDCLLDTKDNRTMIITGPNMAGKSTFMRQVAIITYMAHMGCFVPCKSAEIAITDRIFTRIGASDDLAFGQSTFMVEMTEVANILHNATNKSLLVLDEIGRGTSTYDGLSIAWAVVEYLSGHLNAKTLFATHYHELTDLEGRIDGVKNYRVLIKELNNTIVFLHKIARGSANKSFGIEVASIAGLPTEIIARAKEILYIQENANDNATKKSFNMTDGAVNKMKQNINSEEIINILKDIDMNTMSPLVAFTTLQNLVDKVRS